MRRRVLRVRLGRQHSETEVAERAGPPRRVAAMKRTPVSRFMSRELIVARPEMPLTKLVALLQEHCVRGLPVTDESNRLVGVVSETDLFLKEKGVPFSLEKVPSLLGQVVDRDEVDQVELCKKVRVGEVMTSTVTSVAEEATLEEVAMLMYERHLTMLPVVRDGELVGVVRRIDVLRLLYGEG